MAPGASVRDRSRRLHPSEPSVPTSVRAFPRVVEPVAHDERLADAPAASVRARSRRLHPSERSVPTSVRAFPRVVEPVAHDERLADFFAAHGAELVAHVRAHGAVLLRGFGALDVARFDAAMLELAPAMRPMGDYFLAEDGRDRVVGTRHCRATNAFKPTGGYLRQEVVAHSENYYCADVPEFVAFFCEAAPPAGHGGETGLFCGVRALAALPPPLRAKLESQSFVARVVRARAELAAECALPPTATLAELAAAAEARGAAACVPIRGHPDMLELQLRKPTIVAGGGAGRRGARALALNASELGSHGLVALARELEARVYTAERGWALRRLLWRAARALGPLARALELVESLAVALRAPLRWLRYRRRERARARAAASAAAASAAAGGAPTLRAALRLREAECIGAALGRAVSLFEWHAGDVLLIDNLTVMHDGMPGSPWAPRTLHAMLCNPLRVCGGPSDHAAPRAGGGRAGARQSGVFVVS